MLPVSMRNDHRPATPVGVCLSGHQVRCPECGKPGALDGLLGDGPITLCARCGRLMVPETATNNPREVK
ncbi:hypothetical protein [Mariprofundus ferrooxydans]|uniref:hypothetical protein n=1 Tax=Mariprofundus ferrooxydans TaxID=314344 RepID=UPI00143109E7|nr:hypothetical protein [Mariprofundus ferrooxydans]